VELVGIFVNFGGFQRFGKVMDGGVQIVRNLLEVSFVLVGFLLVEIVGMRLFQIIIFSVGRFEDVSQVVVGLGRSRRRNWAESAALDFSQDKDGASPGELGVSLVSENAEDKATSGGNSLQSEFTVEGFEFVMSIRGGVQDVARVLIRTMVDVHVWLADLNWSVGTVDMSTDLAELDTLRGLDDLVGGGTFSGNGFLSNFEVGVLGVRSPLGVDLESSGQTTLNVASPFRNRVAQDNAFGKVVTVQFDVEGFSQGVEFLVGLDTEGSCRVEVIFTIVRTKLQVFQFDLDKAIGFLEADGSRNVVDRCKANQVIGSGTHASSVVVHILASNLEVGSGASADDESQNKKSRRALHDGN
jgi:hypothetical protein